MESYVPTNQQKLLPDQAEATDIIMSIDKLRTIKPFAEKQLLDFYPNSLLDSNHKLLYEFYQKYIEKHRNDYYELIEQNEKSIKRYADTKYSVDRLVSSIKELENKCWNKIENIKTGCARCNDGEVVTFSQNFDDCKFDADSCESLNKYYYVLRERILNDHVVHLFYQKLNQLKFELVVHEMCDIVQRISNSLLHCIENAHSQSFPLPYDDTEHLEPEYRLSKQQLLDWITALFAYLRKSVQQCDKNIRKQCYKAVMFLSERLLSIANFDDCLFLLNHIVHHFSGSSVLFVSLIRCPNPLPLRNTDHYDLGKQYVDFAVTVLSTILSSFTLNRNKFPDKSISNQNDSQNNLPLKQNYSDSWIFVENDFECELMNINENDLTEYDIINYLERVPFQEILDFMSLIEYGNSPNKNNDINETANENLLVQSAEISMMKLFAFNTRLIHILRNGLRNFNCNRYKQLTMYIASLIRKIIKNISDNWNWCKTNCSTTDQAFLVRLHVEFDNFMLRSIMAILSVNQRGVWPLLASINFSGISESMLWHILWVVYSNSSDVDTNELGSGLCPYMSANYWKDKFSSHSQWKYVFVEKLSILSEDDAVGLLSFFYNMAISRDEKLETSFLQELLSRISEICLLRKFSRFCKAENNGSISISADTSLIICNQNFFIQKGIECLTNLLNNFKTLIIFQLEFISLNAESNLLEEPLIQVFTSLYLNNWVPEKRCLSLLYKWLEEKSYQTVYNRLARIVLSKLAWNQILIHSNNCLMIDQAVQRTHALKLYQASLAQLEFQSKFFEQNNKSKSKFEYKFPSMNSSHFGVNNLLQLAQQSDLDSFMLWCWNSLLVIRIHPLDLFPDESSWDEIVFGITEHSEQLDGRSHITRSTHVAAQRKRMFQYLPRLNYDSELVPISKGVQEGNALAIFIAASMTDVHVECQDINKFVDISNSLAKNGHYHPLLNILYHFIPLNVKHWPQLKTNPKFVALIVSLVQQQFYDDLSSLILLQMKHFDVGTNVMKICTFWSDLLFEVLGQCLNHKSNSWLVYLTPNFISSNTNIIDELVQSIAKIFDKICLHLIVNSSKSLVERYINFLVDNTTLPAKVQSWKLSNLDNANSYGPNLTSTSWFNLQAWSSQKQICYLADRNLLKSEWITPFHVLLRESLNSVSKSKSKSTSTMPINLAYITIELDIKRMAKVWDHLVYQLNYFKIVKNENDANNEPQFDFDKELKQVCGQLELPVIPFWLLPINSLIVWLLKFTPTDLFIMNEPHPLLPLFWKQFFLLYFSNTGSSSVGLMFMTKPMLAELESRLTTIFDYHNRRFMKMENEPKLDSDSVGSQHSLSNQSTSSRISALMFEDRLVKLYRAYKLWLKDVHLHQSFVNLDDDHYAKPEFQSTLLKYIFSENLSFVHNDSSWSDKSSQKQQSQSANSYFFLNYVDRNLLENNLFQYETYWINLVKYDRIELNNGTGLRSTPDNDQTRHEFIEKIWQKCQSSINSVDRQLLVTEASNKSELSDDKLGEFKHIIDHFITLSSSLKVNLLFIDNEYGYNSYETIVNSAVNIHRDEDSGPIDLSVIIVLLHQIIENIFEESRFVDNQLNKYTQLNMEFSIDIIPKLYHDVRRKITKKVFCDSPVNECTGEALIELEFYEWVMNQYVKQKHDLNRNEFNSLLRSLTENLPVPKVIGSVWFVQKLFHYMLRYFDGDANSDTNRAQLNQLFQTITEWISTINSLPKYHVTSMLLDQILDMLNSLSNRYLDQINYFLLKASLQRNITSTMIQQLAPCLMPSQSSARTFIDMYRLIGENFHSTSQQTIFVLLSKFDVNSWLKQPQVTDEERFEFLKCLYHCLGLFGVTPSDEYLVTFDLYRKHLQDFILYRFPLFMNDVLQFLLNGMYATVLPPGLWNSILHTFGFYTKSLSFVVLNGGENSVPSLSPVNINGETNFECTKPLPLYQSSVIDFDYITFDQDLRAYTYRQTIFSSHELYDLLQCMEQFTENLYENLNVEFLDHFKIYITKYLQFVSFMSYCWFTSNSSDTTVSNADNVNNIWRPFFTIWKVAIFPKKSTKFISTDHLNFSWQLFINCFQFLIDTFSAHQSGFISNLWQVFHTFIIECRSVEQNDVTLFEDKLLKLTCWKNFSPSLMDIKLMYDSVIQNRYSVERLNAFVISQVNWKQTLLSPLVISFDSLGNVVESLSYVLITLADQDYVSKVDLQSMPFVLLDPNKVKQITSTLVQVIKQKNQFYHQGQETDSVDEVLPGRSPSLCVLSQSSVYIRLLKALCLVSDGQNPNDDLKPVSQKWEMEPTIAKNAIHDSWLIAKHLCYANSVSTLVAHQCQINPNSVVKSGELKTFLLASVQAMRANFDSFDSTDRRLVFSTLLRSLNETPEEVIRTKLSTHYVTTFTYFAANSVPLIADIIVSIGRTVNSLKCSVYLLECCIENYFDLGGDFNYIVDNLHIGHLSKPQPPSNSANVTPEELISESINTGSCFLLLTHLYGRMKKCTVPLVCTRKYIYNVIAMSASKFKPCPDRFTEESKVLLYWLKLLSWMTNIPNDPTLKVNISILHPFLSSMSTNTAYTNIPHQLDINHEDLFSSFQCLFNLCKSLHDNIAESLNRSILYFFRSQKHFSTCCLFLMECLVLHGSCVIFETFFPDVHIYDDGARSMGAVSPTKDGQNRGGGSYSDSIRDKFESDLLELFNQSAGCLRSWRRNKSFADIATQIDEILMLTKWPKPNQKATTTTTTSTNNNTNDQMNNTNYDPQYNDDYRFDMDRCSIGFGDEQCTERNDNCWNRHHWNNLRQHQLKRYQIIQNWFVKYYLDKNFLKPFFTDDN